ARPLLHKFRLLAWLRFPWLCFSHTEFSLGHLLCHPDQVVISFFGFAVLRIIFCFFAITLFADASKTSPSDPCPSYRCFLIASDNSSAPSKGMSPSSR